MAAIKSSRGTEQRGSSAFIMIVVAVFILRSSFLFVNNDGSLTQAFFPIETKPEAVPIDERHAQEALAAAKKLRQMQGELKRLQSQLSTVQHELNETKTTNKHLTQTINVMQTESNNLQAKQSQVQDDVCDAAFQKAIQGRTQGLSDYHFRRSRAHWGHQYRLDQVAQKLEQKQQLQVVAFGGSITKGHGIERNLTIGSDWYTGRLEHWLNQNYPGAQHRVHNMAQHGADICHLAKRLTTSLDFLKRTQNVQEPDMILLEFAVNDYQGQDHIDYATDILDVFFQGFNDVAMCAEAVVYKLLSSFPKAAVVFVEFRTALLRRKTAQMLHMGVAQHYQVPMISYGDAVLPEFFDMVYNKMTVDNLYTVPIGEKLQPFPFGCQECHPDTMIEQFRGFFRRSGFKQCRTICDIMWDAGTGCNTSGLPPPDRELCYSPLFAVDDVHPSALGHAIATDFIATAIATAVKDNCQREQDGSPQILPPIGWLGTPNALLTRSNFLLVHDADCMSDLCHDLEASFHSPGFELISDSGTFADKPGWIATNSSGGEVVEFDIDLPEGRCYVVYLAILRSYWDGMGMMQVTVIDKKTGRETSVELDSLWEAEISVWSDTQITSDEVPGCTGDCLVRVQTLPQVHNRTANKAKILTLSVRECIK